MSPLLFRARVLSCSFSFRVSQAFRFFSAVSPFTGATSAASPFFFLGAGFSSSAAASFSLSVASFSSCASAGPVGGSGDFFAGTGVAGFTAGVVAGSASCACSAKTRAKHARQVFIKEEESENTSQALATVTERRRDKLTSVKDNNRRLIFVIFIGTRSLA